MADTENICKSVCKSAQHGLGRHDMMIVSVKKSHKGEWDMTDLMMKGPPHGGLWERLSVSDRLPLQLSDQHLLYLTLQLNFPFFHPLLPSPPSSAYKDIKKISAVPAQKDTELVCLYLFSYYNTYFFPVEILFWCVYLIWFKIGPKPQYQMHKCVNRSLSTLGTDQLLIIFINKCTLKYTIFASKM